MLKVLKFLCVSTMSTLSILVFIVMSLGNPNSPFAGFTPAVMERHYSVDELGKLWNLSADTVRRLFEREPGVLVIERGRSRNARRYRTLRIPESVAERVHRRC